MEHDDLAILRRLNASFIHNYVTRDVAAHDALLHPDFICISSSGRFITRADYLKRWADLFDPVVVTYWDTRAESILLKGGLGLVRATNKWVERRPAGEATGMTCYTDTYVKEGGRWRCLQAQLTDVAPEHWPPDETIISIYVNGVRRGP